MATMAMAASSVRSIRSTNPANSTNPADPTSAASVRGTGRAWGRACAAVRGIALPLLVPIALGCGDQSLRPEPPPEPADLYWKLELNHHAVVLSTAEPYDTLQLVAEPRNYRDEPLAGLPAAQYQSTDRDHVIVSSTGVLVAVAPTARPVVVVATLTANNLKHTDTVSVHVVDIAAPPVLASFSIQPLPPDSAKISGASHGGSGLRQPWDTLPARATAAGGEAMPIFGRNSAGYLPVFFRSSDTTLARILPPTADYPGGVVGDMSGVLEGLRPGMVDIYASTTAFGIRMADTVRYRIGEVVAAVVWLNMFDAASEKPPTLVIDDPDIVVGAGGFVTWFAPALQDADTVDITFPDADLASIGPVQPVVDQITNFLGFYGPFYFCSFDCDNGGNLLLTASQRVIGRHFPVPGTYEYHSNRLGQSGRIVVVDER